MKRIANTTQELKDFKGRMEWSRWEQRGESLLRASEACEEILDETSGDAAKCVKRAMKALEGAIEVCEAELSKLRAFQPPIPRRLRIGHES